MVTATRGRTAARATSAAPRRTGQSIRSRWLGRQLARLRESAGKQGRQAAAYIERDSSTLSRYESGEYAIRRADLMALLEYYGVTDQAQRRQLLDLRDEAWQRGWWDEHPEAAENQRLADLIWLESRAETLRLYGLATVPALLQTPAYAEALLCATMPEAGAEQIAGLVDLGTARQRVLGGSRLPEVSVILDESVLHRVVGGRGTMREQLRHLLDLSKRPGFELLLLRIDSGAHPTAETSFTVLGLPDPFPAVAHVETLAGAVFAEGPDTERFTWEFDRLRAGALGPADSAAVLAEAIPDVAHPAAGSV